MRIIRAEWRPPNDGLVHDGTQRPPVTAEAVPATAKNLRSDVVGSADGGVGHRSARLAPVVDLATIAHGQIDLVQVDRGTVVSARTIRGATEKLLVEGAFVLFMETGREPKIREFEMPGDVEKDIVGLDVSALYIAISYIVLEKSERQSRRMYTRKKNEVFSYIKNKSSLKRLGADLQSSSLKRKGRRH